MRVLIIEPNKVPYLKEIGSSLKELQSVVGGDIEAVYPYEDEVAIICNEEGKLNGLEPNRGLKYENGELYDILVGTVFICGLSEDNFASLNDDLAVKYYEYFRYPEIFRYSGFNKIVSEKYLVHGISRDLFPFGENEIVDSIFERPGYKLFNKNLSLRCDEKDMKEHRFENELIMAKLKSSPFSDHALKIKLEFYDIAHRGHTADTYICKDLDHLKKLICDLDTKNGLDFGISPSCGLSIGTYGSRYKHAEKEDLIKTQITVHPIVEPYQADYAIPIKTYINLDCINVEPSLNDIMLSVQQQLKNKTKNRSDREI